LYPLGDWNVGEVRKNRDFRPISRFVSEMIQLPWNVSTYAIYRMVPLPVT